MMMGLCCSFPHKNQTNTQGKTYNLCASNSIFIQQNCKQKRRRRNIYVYIYRPVVSGIFCTNVGKGANVQLFSPNQILLLQTYFYFFVAKNQKKAPLVLFFIYEWVTRKGNLQMANPLACHSAYWLWTKECHDDSYCWMSNRYTTLWTFTSVESTVRCLLSFKRLTLLSVC